MKTFNTTAVCIPEKHYMVDLSERVKTIKKLVDAGKYFTINRARQYGKTTTIDALCKVLVKENVVISLDFQDIEEGSFRDGGEFSKAFARIVLDAEEFDGLPIPKIIIDKLKELIEKPSDQVKMDDLFRVFRIWFTEEKKPVVLIVDEVDTATNNQVLRSLYLKREKSDRVKTFQSVILAGVTDVKHLKSKIRDEDQHKVNSPWNIAADFDIDMSLSENGIGGMLDEYEEDHGTGMDTAQIAKQIREYTNGYPYLVSRICEVIDQKLVPNKFESLEKAWTGYGVDEAVKAIMSEPGNSLFDSLTGKLTNYPDLKDKLRRILLRGETFAWLPYDEAQQQLFMYGFIRNNHNTVAISNRMFEMLLYTHFIGESNRNNELKQMASETRSIFVDQDGWLNVPEIMRHFIREYHRIHENHTEKFLEEEGRERFITYVSAIINGTGTYSIEEQTRNHRRMDLVIHYLGKRYIIEMKIWRGRTTDDCQWQKFIGCEVNRNKQAPQCGVAPIEVADERYNAEGEKQICDYLDYFGLTTGYMLSFSFNKNKKPDVYPVHVGDKLLYEGIV